MTKKELWNIFIKTGSISDYLKYKNAPDTRTELLQGADTEAADELYSDIPDIQEPDYDDFDGWYSN